MAPNDMRRSFYSSIIDKLDDVLNSNTANLYVYDRW